MKTQYFVVKLLYIKLSIGLTENASKFEHLSELTGAFMNFNSRPRNPPPPLVVFYIHISSNFISLEAQLISN